jgi:hypothetical protein
MTSRRTLAGVKLQAETLDFIVDYTKATPRRQTEAAHMIDTKALQVFAAASIVLGLAAAGPLRKGVAAWLFGAAIATVTAFMVLRTRRFRIVDDAENIWPRYWNVELTDVKHALVDDIPRRLPRTLRYLARKAKRSSCSWRRRLQRSCLWEPPCSRLSPRARCRCRDRRTHALCGSTLFGPNSRFVLHNPASSGSRAWAVVVVSAVAAVPSSCQARLGTYWTPRAVAKYVPLWAKSLVTTRSRRPDSNRGPLHYEGGGDPLSPRIRRVWIVSVCTGFRPF